MFYVIHWFMQLIGNIGKSKETANVNFQDINLAKIAVKDATMILLVKKPDHIEEVRSIVTEAGAMLDSGLPIDTIEATAKNKIAESNDLSIEDKIAATAVVSLVRMKVDEQLKKANLTHIGEQAAEIKTILGWVTESCDEAAALTKKALKKKGD